MLSLGSSSQKLGNFSRYLNTCLIQIPIGATTTTSNIYCKVKSVCLYHKKMGCGALFRVVPEIKQVKWSTEGKK